MPANPANDPDAAAPGASGTAPELHATLVVTHEARRAQLRAAFAGLAPRARVDTAKSIFEALLRSTRSPRADLLVLDLAADGAAAPALIRHLARISQTTDVLVFGDHHQSQPRETHDVWAWSEVDVALLRWVEAWRRRSAVQP